MKTQKLMTNHKTGTALMLMFGVVAIVFVSGCTSSGDGTGNVAVSGPEDNKVASVTETADTVKIPLSTISTQASFYSLNVGGKNVNYFVVSGTDGKPRTAFDACDVCGGKKGYRQSGNDMICNNCGRYFNIDSIGTKNRGGGCWPSYLSHEIDGDYIVINKQEIAAGAWRF
jgi:uncharacterized membrane protein